MHPVERYVHDLREIHQSGGGVDEESYYPALRDLLNAVGDELNPKVRCIVQLKNKGAGKPDAGLFTENQVKSKLAPFEGQPPERGAIEAKPPKQDVYTVAASGQVAKYVEKYKRVLVTNLREFLLVALDPDGNQVNLEHYWLAPGEPSFWDTAPRTAAKNDGDRLVAFLKRVMLHAVSIDSPEVVAWFLASYAREALARVEKSRLQSLAVLKGALEKTLGMKFEGSEGEHFFHSSLVQTLFYGGLLRVGLVA